MAEEETPDEAESNAASQDENATFAVAGYAVSALFITGILGILHSIFTGHGEGLIASAIAFGVAAHVSLGK